MTIYIDSDHNGFRLRHELADYLRRSGHEVIDVGSAAIDPEDDFPFAAQRVVTSMRSSEDQDARGILICGSGQGVCMAANRCKGIRASLCWDNWEAKSARNDDDSNVLCLPGRVLQLDAAKAITHVWLTTAFAGAPRFKRRITLLDEIA